MDILCENNAFQNIRKCLDGECIYHDILGNDQYHQIEDFLQFCVQIIFYDRINIAGNVPVNVFYDTKKLIGDLERFGITDVFHIELFGGEDSSEETIAQADKELTGNVIRNLMGNKKRKGFLDDYLAICLNQEHDCLEMLWNFFPPMTDTQKATVTQVTEAIQNGNTGLLKTFNNYATVRKDGGLLKIFSDQRVSKKIIDSARDHKGGWSQLMTLRLMVKFRNLLNQTLADQGEQMLLAPSVIRGRAAIRDHRIFSWIDKVFKNETLTFKDIVDNNIPEFVHIGSVTMPSLTQYLINVSQRNRKKVEKILGETAKLREKFSPVRNYIRDQTESDHYQQWWTGLNEIAKEVSSKIAVLSQCSVIEVIENITVMPTPTPLGVFPIPAPKISVQKGVKLFRDWMMNTKACVQAFTGVIFSGAMNRNIGAEQDLVDYCRRNT